MSDKIGSAVSLSQLLGVVGEAVQLIFKDYVWVTAEVLQVSGVHHKYLELVEYDDNRKEVAKSRAVIWASDKNILSKFRSVSGQDLVPGMKILFKAQPGFHPTFGLSLSIKEIDATFTLGDMEIKVSQIKDMLICKGWWGLNQGLPSPQEYTRIAVVSPIDGAGLGDFKTQADLLESAGLCSFKYYPAPFQGEGAADKICQVIINAHSDHQKLAFDALVIIRGGGDKAGIYQLNHAKLAATVCRFPVPVIVGIGHERDRVILDDITCLRFATPSLAATHIRQKITENIKKAYDDIVTIIRASRRLLERLDYASNREVELLFNNAQSTFNNLNGDVCQLASSMQFKAEALLLDAETKSERLIKSLSTDADSKFKTNLQQSKYLIARTTDICHSHFASQGNMLMAYAKDLASMNPLAVLNRGYCYVTSENGFVTSASDAKQVKELCLNFKDGAFAAMGAIKNERLEKIH